MRNLYVADLKRIVKSKLFLVSCILGAVFAIINPLLNKVLFDLLNLSEFLGGMMTAKSLTFSAFNAADNLGLIMPILIAIIVCRDFSQGTVRNKIICGKSRMSVYFSHLFSAATVICAVMLLHGLLTLGVSICFFSYQETAFTFADFGYLMASLAFEMILYFAIAAIVTLISLIAKGTGTCILLYLAVSFGFTIVGAIFQAAAMFLVSESAGYGIVEFINACNIYTSTLIGTGTAYTAKQVFYVLFAPALLTAASTVLGQYLFARKNLK